METQIYRFGGGLTEGNAGDKDILGGKGAGLQEMSSLGLPVPPGFTFPTTLTSQVGTEEFNEAINDGLLKGLDHLRKLFDYMPLVSVRSGAPVSMPGMMETILNVGLTEASIKSTWKRRLGRKVAYDSYSRLIKMMGETCCGINPEHFKIEEEAVLKKYHIKSYYKLHATGYVAIANRYKKIFKEYSGMDFPDNGVVQLKMAINSVYNSWGASKAVSYRKIHNISDQMGTAVTIQAMVFGNMNDNSMTGVLFSRNPNNGERKLVGEYLVNAQGEDVVNGSVTPKNISDLAYNEMGIYNKLVDIVINKLEPHYKDMQDVEFTVQDGEIFILQTRSGKRTAQAAFRMAVDMLKEKLITKHEVLNRVTATQYFEMKKPIIDPDFKDEPDVIGLAAGGGLVTGKAVMSSQEAVNATFPCIMVTEETTPDDIEGMSVALGILTRKGGMTSHAAVVARGMNKSCVVGCGDLADNIGGKMVTIDGNTGKVWIGKQVPIITPGHDKYVKIVENILIKKYNIKVSHSCDDFSRIDEGSIITVRKGEFDKVHTLLKCSKIKRVILELKSDFDIIDMEADKPILEMFGKDVSIIEDGIEDILLDISSKVKGVGHKIIINIDTEKQGSIISSLRHQGVDFPVQVKKIEDMMSDSLLKISSKFIKDKIGSPQGYINLVEDLRKAGRKVEIFTDSMTIEDVVVNYL